MLFSGRDHRRDSVGVETIGGLCVQGLAVAARCGRQLLQPLTLAISFRGITALIGPKAAGKTVLLRALLRLSDQMDGLRLRGTASLNGQPLRGPRMMPIWNQCGGEWVGAQCFQTAAHHASR